MGERKTDRVGERHRQGQTERERERERESENIVKENSWNFILSCFIPQNGVKHDRQRCRKHFESGGVLQNFS